MIFSFRSRPAVVYIVQSFVKIDNKQFLIKFKRTVGILLIFILHSIKF